MWKMKPATTGRVQEFKHHVGRCRVCCERGRKESNKPTKDTQTGVSKAEQFIHALVFGKHCQLLVAAVCKSERRA